MKKRGRGIGCNLYGVGYGFNRPDHSAATVDVTDDGTVMVYSGVCDMGQGSDTILCQIAAEELGIAYEDVDIVSADTGRTPDAGCSSASRQTYVSGNAVKKAAGEVKANLLKFAGELFGCDADNLEIKEGQVYRKDDPSETMPFKELAKDAHLRGRQFISMGWYDNTTADVNAETNQGDAYATYIYATQVADVEVDTETGEVRVLQVFAAHDVGRAINPDNIEQQVEGAVAQGVGYAIMEEIILKEGKTMTPGFSKFLLPTAMDMPHVITSIVEDLEPKGPYGAKGVGEGAIIPTAVAVVNAVYDAIGVRITDLPITPEKVLEALAEKQ